MNDIQHDCTCETNPLIPQICRIVDIVVESPDTKTFRVQTLAGGKPFAPLPGQLGMFSMMGIGEGMFSITSQGDDYLDFAIKRTGMLTDELHASGVGQLVGLRGPYGNTFPVEALKGKDILFISGGIGLAPVRSFICHAIDNRDDYGKIDIVYGSRSPEDIVFKQNLYNDWPRVPNTEIHLTVDKGDASWNGNVGFVAGFIEKIAFEPQNKAAVICGPPIMIKTCMEALNKMGFTDEQIITTLEMRMKCGIGKCGRCNIGSKFICLDGPVFSLAELRDLPDEM